MKSALSLATLGALAGSAIAEDVLFSSRAGNLNKRFVDDQGNWNVCTY